MLFKNSNATCTHVPHFTYMQCYHMLQLNFTPFPTLQTSRLTLRKISNQDTAAVFELRSNRDVMQYIDRPLAASVDDAFRVIQSIDLALRDNTGITWAITYTGQSELIGTIGFWNVTCAHYRAEFGYMLQSEHHGIMHEALSKVIEYGFTAMQLHSIEATVNPANKASIRLLERNNFMLEGQFRENYYYDGKFLDTYVFSLLTNVRT